MPATKNRVIRDSSRTGTVSKHEARVAVQKLAAERTRTSQTAAAKAPVLRRTK